MNTSAIYFVYQYAHTEWYTQFRDNSIPLEDNVDFKMADWALLYHQVVAKNWRYLFCFCGTVCL